MPFGERRERKRRLLSDITMKHTRTESTQLLGGQETLAVFPMPYRQDISGYTAQSLFQIENNRFDKGCRLVLRKELSTGSRCRSQSSWWQITQLSPLMFRLISPALCNLQVLLLLLPMGLIKTCVFPSLPTCAMTSKPEHEICSRDLPCLWWVQHSSRPMVFTLSGSKWPLLHRLPQWGWANTLCFFDMYAYFIGGFGSVVFTVGFSLSVHCMEFVHNLYRVLTQHVCHL